VALKGRCRHCAIRIPIRYPIIEGLNAIGYVALLGVFGPDWTTVAYGVLYSSLLVVAATDLSHKIIPNAITFPGIAAGLLSGATVLPLGLINSLAMIGAFLGWKPALLTIMVGSFLGSLVGISLIAAGVIKREDYIPFGPFLVCGALVALFFGQPIVDWYQGFLAG
jgi:leader peptidase (prepilin peptidase)/N-methyltransferase